MSKNTSSDAFRQLRVELFDGEEIYEDDKSSSGADEAAVAAKETKCRELMNQSSSPDALKIALADPPLGGNSGLKDRAFKVVMDVLNGIKNAEIKSTVATLSPEEKDVLMKYVYRGMAAAEDGLSASLLLWHGAIVAESGLGSIVRVLADRKTV
eukprot:m.431588 g.431588  ORF g.431588 m.431588 type:complete len:154 (+) comp17323_c0_seq1:284-745(+)